LTLHLWHWATGRTNWLWLWHWAGNWNSDFPGVRDSSVLSHSLHRINALLNFNSLGGRNFDLFTNSPGGRNWYHFFDLPGASHLFHDSRGAWNFYALRDHFGGWNLFFHGDVLETVNHFIDTDHFLAWDLASVSFLSVLGNGLSAVDHLLDFDGFPVWNSFLVFDHFCVWNAHGFHDLSCGLDLLGNVLVISLVEALFDHFGAWNLFLNRLILETVDHFVNGDHLFGWDFAGVWLHFEASDGLGFSACWWAGWCWAA